MSILNQGYSTEQIAKELLGHLFVHESADGVTAGWITETEAYVGVEDRACHSYQGKRTPKVMPMYSDAGTIYTYQMHGHVLFNVVTQEVDEPEAVLIRSIEPVIGKELMLDRRQKSGILLTNGPGKLTQAMGITMAVNGENLEKSKVYIDWHKKCQSKTIETSPRIGIPNKGVWTDKLLRYTVASNPYLSKKNGPVDKDNHGWQTVPSLDNY